MSQDVVKAFYDQLISDQTSGSFYDRVSGRIYELEGPTNAALPLAVFSLITSPYADTFRWFVSQGLYVSSRYLRQEACRHVCGRSDQHGAFHAA